MNIRINKHRFDVTTTNSIPACKHFNDKNHLFERDAEFTVIEKLEEGKETTESLRKRLKERENFWIKELKTLKPHGLNMELNNI